MKARSRTWLESDDEFDKRLKHCLAQADPKKKTTTSQSGGGGYNNTSSAWQTVKKR